MTWEFVAGYLAGSVVTGLLLGAWIRRESRKLVALALRSGELAREASVEFDHATEMHAATLRMIEDYRKDRKEKAGS